MTYIRNQVERFVEAGQEFNRPVPSEFRLHYNVKANSLDANYKYGIIYGDNDPSDAVDEWERDVAAELDR